jgi:peptidoglycan/xylan/chitin deacetylase (PgdA/CDA1 family)
MSKCIDPELGALLHAYELQALTDADQERFELHLMRCRHCFDEVLGFERQARGIRQSAAARETVLEATAGEKAAGGVRQLWGLLWPRVPLLFRPLIPYVILVLCLYPAYLGIAYLASHHDEIRATQTIQLVPNRAANQNVFSIGFSFPQAQKGREYLVEISTMEEHEVVLRYRVSTLDDLGRGELFYPLAKMKLGEYRLVISDPAGAAVGQQYEYRFRIDP